MDVIVPGLSMAMGISEVHHSCTVRWPRMVIRKMVATLVCPWSIRAGPYTVESASASAPV